MDASALEARFAAEPALRAERDRLRSLLRAEQAVQSRALDGVLDANAADRMAARILDRARREQDRPAPVASRGRLWVRLLTASVAVHVLALGVLSWRHFRAPDRARDDRGNERVSFVGPNEDSASPTRDPDAVGGQGPESWATDPYVVSDDRLEIEKFLPDTLPPEASDGARLQQAFFPRGSARPMWVRGNDSMKRLIESRVGSPGGLDRVKAGLSALARLQAGDGSFADLAGAPSVRATSTVLLAFLGDGHSSQSGDHRALVGRGIGWLYDRLLAPGLSSEDRAFTLFALSEDLILSSGSLTPAEARLRRASMHALATTVRDDDLVARRAASPRGVPGGALGGENSDVRWAELAVVAATRAGVLGSTTVVAVIPTYDVASIHPGADVRTAMLDGTSLLKDPRLQQQRGERGAAFTEWNAATARTLSSRLGADGLVAGSTTAASRAEETALLLLALQVAYRTY